MASPSLAGSQWCSDKAAAAPAALSAGRVLGAVLARGREAAELAGGADGGGTWGGQLRYQTLPFCSATAQSELGNVAQHEPAGRAQVWGVSVETGEQERLGWWQLLARFKRPQLRPGVL